MTTVGGEASGSDQPAEARLVIALGTFFVDFSHLASQLQSSVLMRLGARRSQQGDAVTVAVAHVRNARAIVDMFFATLTVGLDLDPEELAIQKALRKELNQVLAERNRLAHGTWRFEDTPARNYSARPNWQRGWLEQMKPGSSPVVESILITPEEIEAEIDRIHRVTGAVMAFSDGCYAGSDLGIKDRLQVAEVDGRRIVQRR